MKKIIAIFLFLGLIFHNSVSSARASEALRCGNGDTGINTAIGCIPVFQGNDTTGLTRFILQWGIGIAGGIALLLILYAGFLIMTSSGNPQRVQSGKELLGAAVSGILLLIFSTFILRFVGVDILGIF